MRRVHECAADELAVARSDGTPAASPAAAAFSTSIASPQPSARPTALPAVNKNTRRRATRQADADHASDQPANVFRPRPSACAVPQWAEEVTAFRTESVGGMWPRLSGGAGESFLL